MRTTVVLFPAIVRSSLTEFPCFPKRVLVALPKRLKWESPTREIFSRVLVGTGKILEATVKMFPVSDIQLKKNDNGGPCS
jgi:hypothetical protein